MKYLIIVLQLFLLISCNTKQTEKGTISSKPNNKSNIHLTKEQLQSAKISFSQLEEKQMASLINVNGKIDVPPQNMVSISMPLGGYLKSTKLLPGMHIKKGEIIAVMEDQQYIQLQQEYLIAKSKLAYSKAEYERQKELNISKANSDKVFQQTEMEYMNQKIAVKALSEKLKLISINPNLVSEFNISKSVNLYAPINGFVSKVNINIGKYVTPSDVLFELVNPTDIHLNLMIFEKDLDKLFIGQKLYAYSNNNPDLKHPCEIILISKDITKERYAEVHCHFEDYDKTLLPGMYMNAEIEINSQKVYALPETAIVHFENKDFAFVANSPNDFSITEVQLGAKEDGYITISNPKDLKGKQIVTNGAYTLLMTLKNKEEDS